MKPEERIAEKWQRLFEEVKGDIFARMDEIARKYIMKNVCQGKDAQNVEYNNVMKNLLGDSLKEEKEHKEDAIPRSKKRRQIVWKKGHLKEKMTATKYESKQCGTDNKENEIERNAFVEDICTRNKNLTTQEKEPETGESDTAAGRSLGGSLTNKGLDGDDTSRVDACKKAVIGEGQGGDLPSDQAGKSDCAVLKSNVSVEAKAVPGLEKYADNKDSLEKKEVIHTIEKDLEFPGNNENAVAVNGSASEAVKDGNLDDILEKSSKSESDAKDRDGSCSKEQSSGASGNSSVEDENQKLNMAFFQLKTQVCATKKNKEPEARSPSFKDRNLYKTAVINSLRKSPFRSRRPNFNLYRPRTEIPAIDSDDEISMEMKFDVPLWAKNPRLNEKVTMQSHDELTSYFESVEPINVHAIFSNVKNVTNESPNRWDAA